MLIAQNDSNTIPNNTCELYYDVKEEYYPRLLVNEDKQSPPEIQSEPSNTAPLTVGIHN